MKMKNAREPPINIEVYMLTLEQVEDFAEKHNGKRE